MHEQYNTAAAPLHMAMLSHVACIDAWCICSECTVENNS